MPVLTSHILIVLSLEPDSKKGPGLPLFLVYRKYKNYFSHANNEDLNNFYYIMIFIPNIT